MTSAARAPVRARKPAANPPSAPVAAELNVPNPSTTGGTSPSAHETAMPMSAQIAPAAAPPPAAWPPRDCAITA
ncbi:MAG TPA: hypothetical protein VE967_18955 [Gemmatimonadaceae bacterium]|nr:hypothetical protein [Gemmatimonadaceae bacterium]